MNQELQKQAIADVAEMIGIYPEVIVIAFHTDAPQASYFAAAVTQRELVLRLRAGIQHVLDDCEGHDALNSLYGIKLLRKLLEMANQ